jgi:threonine synthase
VRESGGRYVAVSDEAIRRYIPEIAQRSGVFGEPAATTAVAGVEEARRSGIVRADETVLCVITGTGLKDVKAAMSAVARPDPIEPRLSAVEAMLGD